MGARLTPPPRPSLDKAIAWVRERAEKGEPLTQRLALEAGVSHTCYFAARRFLRGETPYPHSRPERGQKQAEQAEESPPASDAGPAEAPAEEPSEQAPTPIRGLRTRQAMAWLRAHPDGRPRDARKAGIKQGLYYYALARLEERDHASGRGGIHQREPVTARRRKEPDERAPQPDAVIEVVRRLQEELGVEELILRRGQLEIVQRRVITMVRKE